MHPPHNSIAQFLLHWRFPLLIAIAAPRSVRLLLLAAAAAVVLPQSFFSNTQIGIRHILPVFPLTSLLAAAAFARVPKPLTLSLLGVTAISLATWFPHLIPARQAALSEPEIYTPRRGVYTPAGRF